MNKEELKARLQKNLYKKPGFWEKNFPKVFTWIGTLLLVIGLGIGCYNFYFIQNATKTKGVVLRLDGGAYRQGYAPVVEFLDKSQQAHLHYHMVFSRPPQYQVGEYVDIYYKSDDPENASMGYSWFPILILGGIGLVFIFFGIIFQKAFKL
ncbi:DUF3592 domain-containing protein [Lacihabitans sp. CCS-44]|jgi:hypothetical protein|uniref:DUF3592 domain-containing protein n=1 Tax=Lacihabitans sp. CCS-44 TaxID=2487331 RepID=UPI0020CF13B7|nr:DUF3592 domain-containing protein [Lacihabitans sp. CCS-44]MCP9757621.1 DUF3592 domain-containing protein [Lacihabitans sp. CCS-44]